MRKMGRLLGLVIGWKKEKKNCISYLDTGVAKSTENQPAFKRVGLGPTHLTYLNGLD